MNSRKHRLAEHFHAARELPAGEARQRYIMEELKDDPLLQEELAGLLTAAEAGEDSGVFFTLPRAEDQQTLGSTGQTAVRTDSANAHDKPGTRIGPYKLLQEIGEGGFGIVWMADQIEPVSRRVALKVIKPGMDTREVIARFEAERQAIALMDHPNIARVFDAGTTGTGRPYFAMELVKGIPITRFCDEQRLDTHRRLKLFTDVCSAVNHAHQKGVIHRDIKPSNILVTLHGDSAVPKVIDFGIAKATQQPLTDKTLFTRFEQFIGTPVYMSPEQASLSGLDIDTRTDVYSLGVLLYELITGKPPFDAKSMLAAGLEEMRRIIREDEPPKPSTRLSTVQGEDRTTLTRTHHADPDKLGKFVRGDLDWIVMKAIEKDRTRRYETADAFAKDIRRFLADEPVEAAAPGAIYRLRKFARRHRRMIAATAGAAAVLIAASAVSLWQAAEARESRRVSEMARLKAKIADQEKANAEQQSRLAKAHVREASRSAFATAQQRLAEGKWQEALAHLGLAIRYDSENRHAHHALWLALRCGRPDAGTLSLHSLEHRDSVWSVSFSPDGTRIVTASFDGTAQIWDAGTGQTSSPPHQHNAKVFSASFSPDGTRIVTASEDHTARIWDAKTGQPLGSPLKHNARVSSASFHPNSTRIVTTSADGTAQIWDANTGQPVGSPLEHKAGEMSASFSPDGARIVTAGPDGIAQIRDAMTGQPLGVPLEHKYANSASFSPDGTLIVTASHDHTARVWDANSRQPLCPPLEHKDIVWGAKFSPDGTRIVTASFDGTARVWDSRTGRPLGPPLAHKGKVRSAIFSPDGTRIVTASYDYSARIWDARTSQLLGAPLKHRGPVLSASFSPDGTRIVTASHDHTAQIWEASTCRLPCVPMEHRNPVTSANFSPDGARIVTACREHIARIWDAKTGQPLLPLLKLDHPIHTASISPDGARILTTDVEQTARIWDASTGQPLSPPLKHDGTIKTASFSRDGMRIVTAGEDHTARIWDAKTGQPLWAALEHKDAVWSAGFSPDGLRIVTAGHDHMAQIWDAATGQSHGAPLVHQGPVLSASFSPDGMRIVTASFDNTARMWDTATRQPLAPPLEHRGPIRSANFSPDGAWIVTSSVDNTARIWDAKTSQPLGPPLEHHDEVPSASFSPDGSRIVTAGDDHTARLWDTITGQQLDKETAEKLASFCAGTRLDPQLGIMEPLTPVQRVEIWQQLQPALGQAPDWRFAAERFLPQNPKTFRISNHSPMTLRDGSSRLLRTGHPANIREVLACDPGHPLLQFACSLLEATEDRDNNQPANPVRAAWLCDYGMKRLPADLAAIDLRLAATLVAMVAESLLHEPPEQQETANEVKATVLTLLDRAAKLEPEDEETKKLRDSLR